MSNINKNIIKQAGAAVANATNIAAGLSASTPEPGTIISAIQLVNGGRKIGPSDVAHFTESVCNKLLSLLVSMEPIQSGAGDPSPDNVRPISGRTGLTIYVSPTPNAADATTYAVDWTSQAGTVYGGTLDVVTGVLTVDKVLYTYTGNEAVYSRSGIYIPVKLGASGIYVTNHVICTDFEDVRVGANGWSYIQTTMTPAEVQTYLQNHTVSIVCELATPLTYQLTRTDIVTLVGDNYIWSDSGDLTITE